MGKKNSVECYGARKRANVDNAAMSERGEKSMHAISTSATYAAILLSRAVKKTCKIV